MPKLRFQQGAAMPSLNCRLGRESILFPMRDGLAVAYNAFLIMVGGTFIPTEDAVHFGLMLQLPGKLRTMLAPFVLNVRRTNNAVFGEQISAECF